MIIVEFLIDNWFTIVTSIISIVITILLTLKYVSKKKLSIYAQTIQVYISGVDNKNDKLKITFDGEPVEKMFKTSFYVWNSGNQTIDKKDIVENLPLTIENQGKFLDVAIEKVSREKCNISFSQLEANKYIFDFEYLDAKDGVFVEILHTDTITVKEWTIKGTVIKTCKLASFRNKSMHIKDRIKQTVGEISFLMFLLGMFIVGVMNVFNYIINGFQNLKAPLVQVVFSSMLIIISVPLLVLYISTEYSNIVPKNIINKER